LADELGGNQDSPVRVRAGIAISAVAAVVLALAVPAVASADYGAIAVNPNTGASGVSFNYNRKGPALRRAHRECDGRCRIAVWVRNQCAAVVVNPRKYVPGTGETKRKAIRNARKRSGGTGERLVAWTCSG
jgi:Domain of unknown function (DUF4189)